MLASDCQEIQRFEPIGLGPYDDPTMITRHAREPALAEVPFHVPNARSKPLIEIHQRNRDGFDTLIDTLDT
jgi:hypothetical protein